MIHSITPSSSENMAKVSVLIPSRNEKYLTKTVEGIFAEATGDIEVIIVLDGPASYPLPRKRKNLILIQKPQAEGLRKAINDAVEKASGKYLLKTDAHCLFKKGFDEIFQKDCEDNWVVIPRYYPLDVDHWRRIRGRKPLDYFFLSCPWKNAKYPSKFMMKDCEWSVMDQTRKKLLIDDLMTFTGVCWFMPTAHFRNRLGGLSTSDFGNFAENQEIVLKTWLGGGRVIINKKNWCAHFEQKLTDRGWGLQKRVVLQSHEAIAKYFANNQWQQRVHDFAWLVEKFWPLPTEHDSTRTQAYYWPDDWKSYYSINDEVAKLAQLALKYGSDKCPQLHHFYTDYYAGLFIGRQQDVKKVLEIGVGWPGCMTHVPNYQAGASLFMWQDYFPKALIYGTDIRPDLVFKNNRIETFLCDQTDKAGLMNLIQKIGTDIDLVIDDGSHLPEDQVFTCLTLMPILQDRVIYIIEDARDKEIAKYLKGYQVDIIRKSRMASVWDRLIKVVNKTETHG